MAAEFVFTVRCTVEDNGRREWELVQECTVTYVSDPGKHPTEKAKRELLAAIGCAVDELHHTEAALAAYRENAGTNWPI